MLSSLQLNNLASTLQYSPSYKKIISFCHIHTEPRSLTANKDASYKQQAQALAEPAIFSSKKFDSKEA